MTDLRLAVPGLAAWLAVTITIAASTWVGEGELRQLVVGALTGCALTAVSAMLLRRSWSGVVATAGIGAVIGIASGSVLVFALAQEPVSGWADKRSTAHVIGVITGDPKVLQRTSAAIWQSSSLTELRLDTTYVEVRGNTVAIARPMLLRIDGDRTDGEGANALPGVGSTVEVVGRLMPARNPGVAATISVRDFGDVRALDGPGLLDAMANAMREGLRNSVAGVDPAAGSLVSGLAVGDVSTQSPELADAMQRSGLSHLTAVSGGNVAIILAVVLAVASMAGLRMPYRVLAGLAALTFFVILVRPQPSVIRAAVMGVVMLFALLTGGRRRAIGVLATAVLVIVIIAPALAASWGFALSAFATAGLIVIAPTIADRLANWTVTARWPPALREGLSVTLAAQVATAPLLVAMGAAFGWVAIPANLLAMPAVGAVTILGLAAAIIAPVLPAAGVLLGHVASWPASWIAWVAHTCADLPWATFPLPTGWTGVLLLLAGAVVMWWLVRLVRRRYPYGIPVSVRIALVAPVLAIVIALTLSPLGSRGWPPPGWMLVACDIGQGDALVLRASAETAVLVDVGPDPKLIRGCMDELGVEALSAVILTHFHADHVNGLQGVLDHMAVGSVIVSGVPDPPVEAAHVREIVRAHGLVEHIATAGEASRIGGVAWRVIWPRRIIQRGSVPNNASLVLVAEVAGVRILLPGDIEAEAQAAIIAGEPQLHVDVMKVPHHGSRNQDPRLPAWSRARIALISCGVDNPYGHPHADTLRAWESVGALIGRTDTEGDLAVVRRDRDDLGLVVRAT